MHDVIVVGAGIIGLTTSLSLRDSGYTVKVVADKFSPQTTSDKAGAIWFPYEAAPVDRVLEWSKATLDRLKQFYDIEGSGVYPVEYYLLQVEHIDEFPDWVMLLDKGDYEFTSDIQTSESYSGALKLKVPFIETTTHLRYLHDLGRLNGIEYENSFLSDLEDLRDQAKIIVNCTGLGSYHLIGDKELYPIAGQIVKITSQEGIQFMGVDQGPDALAYVFPRTDGIILGGSAVHRNWSEIPVKELQHEIIRKCKIIEPRLENIEVINTYCGLRPGRHEVRLELEQSQNVIHNYGHGGSGFTVCWGCAEEVVKIANETIGN